MKQEAILNCIFLIIFVLLIIAGYSSIEKNLDKYHNTQNEIINNLNDQIKELNNKFHKKKINDTLIIKYQEIKNNLKLKK